MVLKMWREKWVSFISAFALKTIDYAIFRESLAKADWSKYVQHKCLNVVSLRKDYFTPFMDTKYENTFEENLQNTKLFA